MNNEAQPFFPKTSIYIEKGNPLYFLAGPVRGGGDWQSQVFAEIKRVSSGPSYVAIPWPKTNPHPLMSSNACLGGNEDEFLRQLDWERHYLAKAARFGCIIFWLPMESKVNPRGDGEYARDTRGELGEWRGQMMFDPTIKIVVGAELGFPGLDVIQRNFNAALGREFKIYPTIEETVAAAIVTAKR